MSIDDQMRLIKAISPSAAIQYRDSSFRWYVSTPGVELSDGRCIPGEGITPQAAVGNCYATLTNKNHVFKKGNRYLRWTGFMFDEAVKP